ncbi:MAG: hypothetical protein ACREP2_04715 [Rhodanobacteraceae bacterium]
MSLRFPQVLLALAILLPFGAFAGEASLWVPQWLGAQYTFVDQHQDALRSP